PEHKIGADLIYENYDTEDETVRLAFVQYKLWDRKVFYYDERMDKQIQKMFALTCAKGGLCASPSEREMWVYRLPYCTAFFRPTDRLQSPNSTLHSTGVHMPICAMNFSWENTERGAKVLKKSKILINSVTHRVFEELFICSSLGSKKYRWAELERLYEKFNIFEHEETVI